MHLFHNILFREPRMCVEFVVMHMGVAIQEMKLLCKPLSVEGVLVHVFDELDF